MNTDKKNCPYCAEGISIKAKVCPRCRQWFTLRSWGHPVYQVVPLILAVLFMGWVLLIMMERVIYPRPFYTEIPESLQISESKIFFRETDFGLRLYVVGILTNQSEFAWKDVELECRFFDSNDRMIDVAHLRAPATVRSHDETGFSLAYRPSRATNDYSSFRLKVITARTAPGFF